MTTEAKTQDDVAASDFSPHREDAHEAIVIEAEHGFWPIVNFAELWNHREMLFSLTIREIMRRYKQTLLGVVWAVFPVFANTAMVTLFLTPLMGPSIEVGEGQFQSLPMYIFTGLLPWYLFSTVMHSSAQSVLDHSDLVTRVYFPRLVLPLSCIGDRLLDFVIGFLILCLAMLFGIVDGSPSPLAVPVVLVVVAGLIMASLGVGLIVAAVGVAYRDAFHALGLLAQFWFFATPSIFYSKLRVPEVVRPWLPLNPVFGLIENFRNTMTGNALDVWSFSISLGVSIVMLLVGVVYFQRAQRTFSDVM